jgi:ribosomal protein S18 acetylase RimI-like enzyme
MNDSAIRHAEPADYQPIISVLNDWWGGRNMSGMLPRLFFVHFRQTSFVIEREGKIVGFLIGFLSQTYPDQAYIHFAGVHPDHRRRGLASMLYEHFMGVARNHGCRVVRCVTSPVNRASIAFHLRTGFSIEPGDKVIEGISVAGNYDGHDGDRVLLAKTLDAQGKAHA